MIMSNPKVIAERYVLKEEIGVGGSAIVYKAYDTKSLRDVAAKKFLPNNGFTIERFRQEAELQRQYSFHDNILSILDFVEEDENCYIFTPLMDGDLNDFIEKAGQLSVDNTLNIFSQIADALITLHEETNLNPRVVIWRDCKPGNILISNYGKKACLADLGVAKQPNTAFSVQTQSAGLIGTVGFLPVEAIQHDGEVSVKWDIYALGISMFQSLVGKHPFELGNNALAAWAGGSMRLVDLMIEQRPELPTAIPALVGLLTHNDPSIRPTAQATVKMISAIVSQLSADKFKTIIHG